MKRSLLIAALLGAWPTVHAGLSAEIELEQRFFLHAAPVPNRERDYLAVGAEIEFSESYNRGRQAFTGTIAARHDYDDPDRRYFELLDLETIIREGALEYRFGVRRVFWGVTEAVHLVDIVNQTDLFYF